MKKGSNRPTCSRLAAVALLLGMAAAPELIAQGAPSSLRGWGNDHFDTEAYAAPALFLAAHDRSSAVLRADGRIFVHGSTQLPDGPPPPLTSSYTQIAIGTEHGFGLLANGSIVVWAASATNLPAPPLPAGTTYVKVVAGYRHALALRSDGIAVAWGDNSSGQALIPAIPAGLTVVDLHAGSSWSLLQLSNGTLLAFGSNYSGQLAVPALPPGVTYATVWGGSNRAIALCSDGSLVAWGDNTSGQGNVPPLPAGLTYTRLALGAGHTAALRSDGTIATWGNSSYGEGAVPTLPSGVACVQLVAAGQHTLARFANGTVLGWGSPNRSLPIPALASGEVWIAASAGTEGLGLTSTGRVVGIAGGEVAPALPPGLTYTAVIGGAIHSVALRSDGRAVAWGSNQNGQCAIPPLPPGMTYTDAVTTWSSTVLLRSDGQVAIAGNGSSLPTLPQGMRYVAIACHDQGRLLLRSDGTLLVTGSSSNGVTTPPPLPAGVQYVAVARNRYYNSALRSDGAIDQWGTTLAAPLPPLPSGVVYVEVDSGDDVLVARRSDGRIVAAAPTLADPILNVPIPAAGESFVGVTANHYSYGLVRVGPTSTYVTIASGCAGTRPVSRLVPRDTPRLGKNLQVTLFDLPQDAAVMAFGWNRTAPTSLASYGMPGCSQHVTTDAAVLLLGQGAQAKFYLGVPNELSLLGLHFHNQAIVLDIAANAAGAVVSNAAEGVIGAW